jgi:hypothetical protein
MQDRAAAKRFCSPVSRCRDEITDAQIDAAVAAAEHLANLGVHGMFEKDICRAMYRKGHHAVATRCFLFSHGEAAA